MMKKIIISGGTGFIGQHLSKTLKEKDYYVIILTRNNNLKNIQDEFNDEYLMWQDINKQKFLDKFEDVNAVINLAGASIAAQRWTESYKNTILASRMKSTESIIEIIKNTKHKPKVLINASAVGFYGNRGDDFLDESSTMGEGFLSKVCFKWEQSALQAKNIIRVVTPRIGVVLDKNEGALPKMIFPYKYYFGGTLGSGKQWVPWIHIDDLVNLIIWTIENKNIENALNCSSPQPVTMSEFSSVLSKSLNRPNLFKVPDFILKIALGESSEMILNSIRSIPNKAIRNGYKFKYNILEEALEVII